jgi:hypothetical protein
MADSTTLLTVSTILNNIIVIISIGAIGSIIVAALAGFIAWFYDKFFVGPMHQHDFDALDSINILDQVSKLPRYPRGDPAAKSGDTVD